MTWTGSEQYLLDFMGDSNKKYPSIKFEFKCSQTKIDFLDVLVYKDQNNMLQATIYRKQTDQQNYLDTLQASLTDKTNLFFTGRILKSHNENEQSILKAWT